MQNNGDKGLGLITTGADEEAAAAVSSGQAAGSCGLSVFESSVVELLDRQGGDRTTRRGTLIGSAGASDSNDPKWKNVLSVIDSVARGVPCQEAAPSPTAGSGMQASDESESDGGSTTGSDGIEAHPASALESIPPDGRRESTAESEIGQRRSGGRSSN